MKKSEIFAALFLFSVVGCQKEKAVAYETEDTGTATGEEQQIATDSNADVDTNTEVDTSTSMDTDTETDVPTDSDTNGDSDSNLEPPTDTDGDTDTDSTLTCGVPTSFQWRSSPELLPPAEGDIAIKDPTVLRHDGKWHIYATTKNSEDDWGMTYLSFENWDEARGAPRTPVSENPELTGYKVSPQLFYFSPQEIWYLIYQTQEPAYSTSTDPTDVRSWSETTLFMPMPDIIEDSDTGGIDYWVICDDSDCYLYFTADNGVLYRARTPKADFPNGFAGTTEIVLVDEMFDLFQGCNVYRIPEADRDTYLLTVVAISSERNRYFRSWTADRLDGDWTPLADTEETPFASIFNVTDGDWALDGINQGEMLRDNPDETMTIDTCNMRYLYQGLIFEGTSHGTNGYSLGLLTDAR